MHGLITVIGKNLSRFCVATTLTIAALNGFAQNFPQRAITLVFPYAAGSSTDGLLRLVAAEASQTLGQQVVVENRTGSIGRAGLNALSSAPKDGYFLVAGTTGELVTHGLVDPALRLDARRDYVPVAGFFKTYVVLIANPSVPFRDLNGLIAYAKANPGKLNFSWGSAGPSLLTLGFLKEHSGLDIVSVPYRGSPPALLALVSGEIHLTAADPNAVKPLIESGKAIGIAVAGPERLKSVPSLPTMAEGGMSGFSSETFVGVIAPTGTPAPIVARLNSTFASALRNPGVMSRVEAAGFIVTGLSPEQFSTQIRATEEMLGPIVRKMEIKLN